MPNATIFPLKCMQKRVTSLLIRPNVSFIMSPTGSKCTTHLLCQVCVSKPGGEKEKEEEEVSEHCLGASIDEDLFRRKEPCQEIINE